MKIKLNGTPTEVEDGTTVEAFILKTTGSTRGCAAVVDGTVLPRTEWPYQLLTEGCDVEIVTAVQGG